MQIDRRRGVRSVLPRMLIKFSLTVLIVMMVGGYYTYNQVLEKMQIMEEENIHSVTDGTVAGMSDMILTKDYAHLQETLRQSMDNQSIIGLTVTTLEGKVLSEVVRVGRVPEPQFNHETLLPPVNNDTKSLVTRIGSTVTVWQRIDSMVHIGWLKITLTTKHYDNIINELIRNIIITIIAMLSVIIVVILWQYAKSYRQLRFYEKNLLDAAHTDALTGLPNRLMLSHYLNRSTSRAMTSQTGFSIAFIDLDGFKQVNDTYGHNSGDELLIEIALRLTATLRGDDQIIRLGGDEFVLILNETNHDITEQLLNRVLKVIEQPYTLTSGDTTMISASIGVSEFTRTKIDSNTMLSEADAAMYRAKSGGRGCIVYGVN